MIKQGLILVVLQALNMILGLFATIYLAINVDAKVYSFLAVVVVVNNIFVYFSGAGYEVYLLRKMLSWSNGRNFRIKYKITYALVLRFFMSLICFVPVVIYLSYLYFYSYSQHYGVLLVVIAISGIFCGLNDGVSLIARGFNNYIAAFNISVVPSVTSRLIGLVLFDNVGMEGFILIQTLCQPIVFFLSLLMYRDLRENFSISLFSFKHIGKINKHFSFAWSGYARFIYFSADRMLISIILPASLLGSYNLARQMFDVARTAIDSFFDPMIQRYVSFSSQFESNAFIAKVNRIHLILLVPIYLIGFSVITQSDYIVGLAGADYQYLGQYILAASLAVMILYLYKIKQSVLSLRLAPNLLLRIEIIVGIANLTFLALLIILQQSALIFFAKVIAEFVSLIVIFHMWNKEYVNEVCNSR